MNTVSKLYQEPKAIHLEEVLVELVKVYNHRRQSILNQYQVVDQEVDIINYLNEQEMKKMKEVGEFFNIKLSTLTSTIDKLEKNKLVKRKSSKDDRRVIFIRPTAKGQNLLNELDQFTREAVNNKAGSLKQHEFDTLISGIKSIVDAFKISG